MPMPATQLIAIRIAGEIRLLSNEYFTKKATPKKSARPPIHANSLTPMNCSQLIEETLTGGASNTGTGSCSTGVCSTDAGDSTSGSTGGGSGRGGGGVAGGVTTAAGCGT